MNHVSINRNLILKSGSRQMRNGGRLKNKSKNTSLGRKLTSRENGCWLIWREINCSREPLARVTNSAFKREKRNSLLKNRPKYR